MEIPRIQLPSEVERCIQQGGEDCDGDGFIDNRVFNVGGARGDDCDDTRRFIHPGAAELPNKIDDDCDGEIDNLYGEWWWPGGTPPK